MPTIAQLDQRHPTWDDADYSELAALYDGDKLLKAKIRSLLPQQQAEPPDRYELRIRLAQYRNYMGAIIDFFAALLFTSRPEISATTAGNHEPVGDEYYQALRENCDRNGQDVDFFFKARLIDAMVHKCSWWSVESPDRGESVPLTRAEFDESGHRDCWLRALSGESVVDWETNDVGALDWALVHSISAKRGELGEGRNTVTRTWEHYLPDRVDVYSITYDLKKKPRENTDVPLVATRRHGFGVVPIVCMDLPKALHAAGKLRSTQLAHLRVSNDHNWALSRAAHQMIVLNLEDADRPPPPVGAGWGLILGKEEKAGYIAPPDGAFEPRSKEVRDLKDEIFRLAHQMALGVENNAAAIGRSAASKATDSESTKVILLAYARQVKEAIENTYRMIGAARGDDYQWNCSGLDSFSATDLNFLLGSMEHLSKYPIDSPTLKRELNTRLADAMLPDLDQATKYTLHKEIAASSETPGKDETE